MAEDTPSTTTGRREKEIANQTRDGVDEAFLNW